MTVIRTPAASTSLEPISVAVWRDILEQDTPAKVCSGILSEHCAHCLILAGFEVEPTVMTPTGRPLHSTV